jgi:hypothetical protein
MHYKTPFSDVIDLAGTSGNPAAFFPVYSGKIRGRKCDQPKPAKLQARISIKRVILEK